MTKTSSSGRPAASPEARSAARRVAAAWPRFGRQVRRSSSRRGARSRSMSAVPEDLADAADLVVRHLRKARKREHVLRGVLGDRQPHAGRGRTGENGLSMIRNRIVDRGRDSLASKRPLNALDDPPRARRTGGRRSRPRTSPGCAGEGRPLLDTVERSHGGARSSRRHEAASRGAQRPATRRVDCCVRRGTTERYFVSPTVLAEPAHAFAQGTRRSVTTAPPSPTAPRFFVG